jgi:hypothetical protein
VLAYLPEMRRLLVTEYRSTGYEVKTLDLERGSWQSVGTGTSAEVPVVRVSDAGAVVALQAPGSLSIWTSAGDAFEQVVRAQVPEGFFIQDKFMRRYRLNGSEHLFVAGVGHFARSAAGWVSAELPGGVGPELEWIATSSSGSLLCALGKDGGAWITGGTRTVSLAAQGSNRCGFSPDGSRVFFNASYNEGELRVYQTEGGLQAIFPNLQLHESRAGFAYGSNGPAGNELVRLNWQTLELEVLLGREQLPAGWCAVELQSATSEYPEGYFDNSVRSEVWPLEAALIVEQQCGCIDSRCSGVYVLPLDGSAPRPLFEPREWAGFLDIATLADGSALIAGQEKAVGFGAQSSDRLLRIAPNGDVTELGPFPDLPAPLHAPLGFKANERYLQP